MFDPVILNDRKIILLDRYVIKVDYYNGIFSDYVPDESVRHKK